LKVFEELKMLPNVVLTPHIAGWTVESKKKTAEVLADKINRAIGI
jgi:D-3-phosphoglycerate dehydrogenase